MARSGLLRAWLGQIIGPNDHGLAAAGISKTLATRGALMASWVVTRWVETAMLTLLHQQVNLNKSDQDAPGEGLGRGKYCGGPPWPRSTVPPRTEDGKHGS